MKHLILILLFAGCSSSHFAQVISGSAISSDMVRYYQPFGASEGTADISAACVCPYAGTLSNLLVSGSSEVTVFVNGTGTLLSGTDSTDIIPVSKGDRVCVQVFNANGSRASWGFTYIKN